MEDDATKIDWQDALKKGQVLHSVTAFFEVFFSLLYRTCVY